MPMHATPMKKDTRPTQDFNLCTCASYLSWLSNNKSAYRTIWTKNEQLQNYKQNSQGSQH